MTTAEEYRTAAHQLYDQALVELEAGDLRQASEKLWGAAAQVLKSFAERNGWEHKTRIPRLRCQSFEADANLAIPRIGEWFLACGALHGNFYENWMNEFDIRNPLIRCTSTHRTIAQTSIDANQSNASDRLTTSPVELPIPNWRRPLNELAA